MLALAAHLKKSLEGAAERHEPAADDRGESDPRGGFHTSFDHDGTTPRDAAHSARETPSPARPGRVIARTLFGYASARSDGMRARDTWLYGCVHHKMAEAEQVKRW